MPVVNYKYYQVTFNGKQQDSMLIEKAGTYKSVMGLKNYFTVPSALIVQLDGSNKKSYVQLISKENYRIDKVQIFASGNKFFQRNIIITVNIFHTGMKEQKTEIISSSSDNIFYPDFGFITPDTGILNLVIENEDNPPIRIDSVLFFQNAYSIHAYLNSGKKYQLVFGNDSIHSPSYDLTAFKDSVLSSNKLLNSGVIVFNKINVVETKEKSLFTKAWLWAIIALVLGLLLFFTSSMLKQIQKKDMEH